MTTKAKTERSTTISMERRRVESVDKNKAHVAGGNHTGIIINKEMTNGAGKLDLALDPDPILMH